MVDCFQRHGECLRLEVAGCSFLYDGVGKGIS